MIAWRTLTLSSGFLVWFIASQWQVVSGTVTMRKSFSFSKVLMLRGDRPGRPITRSIALRFSSSTRSASLGTNFSTTFWNCGTPRQWSLRASSTTSTPGVLVVSV